MLEAFTEDGKLQEQTRVATDGTLTVYADERTRDALAASSIADAITAHFKRIKANDYIAFLDYIEETPEHEAVIQEIRTHLRDATRCATTTGYGPRFLHSTGQLHKGGADNGVFLQLTAPDTGDLPIPEQTYTFSTLKQAQALGDFRALASRHRRAIRIDLGADVLAGLKLLRDHIKQALPRTTSTTSGD